MMKWFIGLCALLVVGVVCMQTRVSHATPPAFTCYESAIHKLQPMMADERVRDLAQVFYEAGRESKIDPLLLIAIAFRESSLSMSVERLRRRGKKGEVGLMQVMPGSPAMMLRPGQCTEELNGARCQVLTGARWLAAVRDRCPGSPWRWTTAYGMRRCPTEQFSGMHYGTRYLREIYLSIGGLAWP
jgi:hypothetical protein